MAALTRNQVKEYIRIKTKERKGDNIVNTFLDVELNLTQRKVQKDVLPLALKQYTKIVYAAGPYVAAPADLLDVPNAMIDVKVSTGVRASVTTNFTGANNDILFTWNEPGTEGNITDVIAINDAQASGIVITYTFDSSGVPFFLVSFAPGTTANAVIAAVVADPVMSEFVTASNPAGSTGAGTITLGVSVTHSTTGGTGTGFIAADEMSVEDYNRVEELSLITPSSVQPKYAKFGSTNKTQLLRFLPRTITYVMQVYKFRVADLTADTDVLTVGIDYEELVLLDLLFKTFEMLQEQAEVATKKIQYENEKTKYLNNYQDTLKAMVQEKTRMESADKGN